MTDLSHRHFGLQQSTRERISSSKNRYTKTKRRLLSCRASQRKNVPSPPRCRQGPGCGPASRVGPAWKTPWAAGADRGCAEDIDPRPDGRSWHIGVCHRRHRPWQRRRVGGQSMPGQKRRVVGQSMPRRRKRVVGQSMPGRRKRMVGQSMPGRRKRVGGQSMPGQRKRVGGQSMPGRRGRVGDQSMPGQKRRVVGQSMPRRRGRGRANTHVTRLMRDLKSKGFGPWNRVADFSPCSSELC
jgi:hypothetical protein